MPITILYEAVLEPLVTLQDARDRIAQITQDLFPGQALLVDIAINEALQNAADYRKPGTNVHIEIKNIDDHDFVVSITNDVDSFDPKEWMFKAQTEDWASGFDMGSGRGIMIMYNVFDQLMYDRREETMSVTMVKRI